MKLTELYLYGHPKFDEFKLDLRYPEGHDRAGAPLDKLCLLGLNGVGKASLLELLQKFLSQPLMYRSDHLLLAGLEVQDKQIIAVCVRNTTQFFYDSIREEEGWLQELRRDMAVTMAFTQKYKDHLIGAEDEPEIFDELWTEDEGSRLLLHRPAESRMNHLVSQNEFPQVKFRHIQEMKGNLSSTQVISAEKTREVWALLLFLLNERNIGDYRGPDPLEHLAEIWNALLAPAELEFVYEPVPTSGPVDAVNAGFLRKGSGFPVMVGDLAPGLRHLLFNLGHAALLFLAKSVQEAWVILDQPELYLHPKFQQGLMEQWLKLHPDAVVLCSTHSPFIAAAFDPAERFVLELEPTGQVNARRSEASAGAEVSEILEKDF